MTKRGTWFLFLMTIIICFTSFNPFLFIRAILILTEVEPGKEDQNRHENGQYFHCDKYSDRGKIYLLECIYSSIMPVYMTIMSIYKSIMPIDMTIMAVDMTIISIDNSIMAVDMTKMPIYNAIMSIYTVIMSDYIVVTEWYSRNDPS